MLTSATEPILLHGDLHHGNILAAKRQLWLAIDPQGIAGDPAYEMGALLRNPFPQLPPPTDLARIQTRRVEQLAEVLGFDRERIFGWGIAQAILSAWWSIEDHGQGWEHAIAYAQALLQAQNHGKRSISAGSQAAA